MQVNGNAKELQLHAVVIRADGTIEDRGVIDYWHKNPIKRLQWRINKWLHYLSIQVKRLLQTI
jgi:hypothetical protein